MQPIFFCKLKCYFILYDFSTNGNIFFQQTLLSQQYDKHPIFILKDVKFQELRAMMDYMYRGEVNISQDQLAALLKAAESLQIKGLSDSRGGGNNSTNMPSQAHLKSDVKSSQVPAPKVSLKNQQQSYDVTNDFLSFVSL